MANAGGGGTRDIRVFLPRPLWKQKRFRQSIYTYIYLLKPSILSHTHAQMQCAIQRQFVIQLQFQPAVFHSIPLRFSFSFQFKLKRNCRSCMIGRH